MRRIRDESWELVDDYVDNGDSARTADRPRLRAMLARVGEDADIDAIVVHEADRLARDMGAEGLAPLAHATAGDLRMAKLRTRPGKSTEDGEAEDAASATPAPRSRK